MKLGNEYESHLKLTSKTSSSFQEYLQTTNPNHHTLPSYFSKIKDTTHRIMITKLITHSHCLATKRDKYTRQIEPTVKFHLKNVTKTHKKTSITDSLTALGVKSYNQGPIYLKQLSAVWAISQMIKNLCTN